MTIRALLVVLLFTGCAPVSPPLVLGSSAGGSLSALPACPVVDRRIEHLVEVHLRPGAESTLRYFHRDIVDESWVENRTFLVSSPVRLAPGERVRVGTIAAVGGKTLTVRWQSVWGSGTVEFTTDHEAGVFLTRILGARGIPEREFVRSAVVLYERPCDPGSRPEAPAFLEGGGR